MQDLRFIPSAIYCHAVQRKSVDVSDKHVAFLYRAEE
jgi:hypothetical protein